jgi:hypothetical protein
MITGILTDLPGRMPTRFGVLFVSLLEKRGHDHAPSTSTNRNLAPNQTPPENISLGNISPKMSSFTILMPIPALV